MFGSGRAQRRQVVATSRRSIYEFEGEGGWHCPMMNDPASPRIELVRRRKKPRLPT
jgi:hypothetical protein